MPIGHVVAHRGLPKEVEFVESAEAELAVVEAWIDLAVERRRAQYFAYRCLPSWPLYLFWQQPFFFSYMEVALIHDESGVGKEETECGCPSSAAVA